MENKLQIFENPEFGQIRTVLINGVVYFVGKDVATALGYVNTRDALFKHVDAEDKGESQIATPSGVQTMTVINESGLYSLILSSNLPKAKEFKRWVTAEVLPAIRKTGMYVLDNSKKNLEAYKKIAADPEFLMQMALTLKAANEETKRLQTENAVLNQQVSELTPKATYTDLILNCKGAIPISIIAKDYGMSEVKMNQLLHELGVQFNIGGTWLLYSQYAQLGWTSTKTITYKDDDGLIHSKVHTYWTQKGRFGIYEILKNNGYLPKIEK